MTDAQNIALRCAAHFTGEDVLAPMAHTFCRFGHWFISNRAHFEAIDVDAARQVEAVIRRCTTPFAPSVSM